MLLQFLSTLIAPGGPPARAHEPHDPLALIHELRVHEVTPGRGDDRVRRLRSLLAVAEAGPAVWRRHDVLLPAVLHLRGGKRHALVTEIAVDRFVVLTPVAPGVGAPGECELVSRGVRYVFPFRVAWHSEAHGRHGLELVAAPRTLAPPREVIQAARPAPSDRGAAPAGMAPSWSGLLIQR